MVDQSSTEHLGSADLLSAAPAHRAGAARISNRARSVENVIRGALRPDGSSRAFRHEGRLCRRPDVLHVAKAPGRCEVMGVVKFDPDEIAVKVLRCNERRAGAAERVKYDPASLAERPDEGLQRFDWLLRGMKAIACVCEVDDIGQRKFRRSRVTFCQKISLFVLVAQEASGRCVFFAEYDVSDDAEPGGAPRGDEQVGLAPAIEAHAKRAVFQKAVHLREGRM